ncbi:hypothetical protein FB45DRAFT_1053237 [Roridomyces roridus]|uniref:F-box domain-containing protein n=1 Tax=Roridomyces roridus TaxID=1738132 RepID=A0AAD7CBV4_9AGAR|nr:hypothetical protein FB45DRAFT_1053237 [Roridomyces roridus]
MYYSGHVRSRLAEIERDIAFHETQLGLLHTERKSTERHLHAIAVYPVLTLPNEITSEIFIQWVYTDKKSNPLHLTWVCKLWRAVAISTPQLWACLKNVPRGRGDEFLTKWLSHSGNLPLDLTFGFRASSPVPMDSFVYPTISRHSSQLETLTLWSDDTVTLPSEPFPRLKKLSVTMLSSSDGVLDIDGIAPLAAPQLREVPESRLATKGAGH